LNELRRSTTGSIEQQRQGIHKNQVEQTSSIEELTISSDSVETYLAAIADKAVLHVDDMVKTAFQPLLPNTY